jgi:hypothetical protein
MGYLEHASGKKAFVVRSIDVHTTHLISVAFSR